MKIDLREISLPEVGQDVAVAVDFWLLRPAIG